MPLHDHKEMTGFLKIIAGTVKIQSYTRTNPTDSNPNHIEVREDPEKIVDTNTESSMLTPSESNYHEITAIQGPAAFFDILTPPYETEFFDASKNSMEKRVCNFYRKIQNPDNTLYLEKIPTPRHYWCDSFYYPQDYLKSDYSC
jgi:cysteamine dioxygenase